MRFQRLDLNLLVAFDALSSEEKLIDAARRLNLSQSATSGALARLRQYFDDELFVPQGGRMTPTPLARSLARPVRDVLLEIQSRITNRESFDPAVSDATFKIAASDYVSNVILADMCAQIYQQAPHVRIEVFPIQPRVQTELDRGEFDLIILPEAYAAPHHPTKNLFQDDFTCIVWKHNPLVEDELTLEQFETLGHVGLGLGSTRAPTIEQHLTMVSGHRRRVEVVVSSFSSIAPFVVGTNRIATVQWRLACQAALHYPLRLLRPPLPTPVLTETMQWHSYQTNDPKHCWLRQVVEDCAAAMPSLEPRSSGAIINTN